MAQKSLDTIFNILDIECQVTYAPSCIMLYLKASQFILLTKYYSGGQINLDKIGGAHHMANDTWHVACNGENKNVYRLSGDCRGNPEEK